MATESFKYFNLTANMSVKRNTDDINIKQELSDAMPIDFSFLKLCNLTDVDDFPKKPREGRVGKTPTKYKNKKYITKSLWLGNNFLTSTQGIEQFVNTFIAFPDVLSWIDFSFNNIQEIAPDILCFPNLLILNFHGNAIDNYDTLLKLRDLPKLKKLTVHGCPISETPDYRISMIHLLPKLLSLDFSPIVKKERDTLCPKVIRRKLLDLNPE